jgi:hypothetical protein
MFIVITMRDSFSIESVEDFVVDLLGDDSLSSPDTMMLSRECLNERVTGC